MEYTVTPAIPVQICICCGCQFVPHPSAATRTQRCKPCSKLNSDGYWKERKRPRKVQPPVDDWDFAPEISRDDPINASLSQRGYELVCDPSGDFKIGAKFTALDLTANRRAEMAGTFARREWAVGTAWRDIRHGRVWRVSICGKLEEVTA